MTASPSDLPQLPKSQRTECGITHAQAMEAGRRFYQESDAAPTIAHEMNIEWDDVCGVLGGRIWPGVRQFWMDRIFPGPHNRGASP